MSYSLVGVRRCDITVSVSDGEAAGSTPLLCDNCEKVVLMQVPLSPISSIIWYWPNGSGALLLVGTTISH